MKKTSFTKILALIAVVAITAVASVAGTLAYLTDRDSKSNVFTVGDVSIRLDETFEPESELLPGVTIEKIPVITNTGKNDAWVWLEFAVPTALDNWNPGNGETGSNNNVLHWNPLGATHEGIVNEDRVQAAIEAGYLPAGLTAEEIITNNMTWDVINNKLEYQKKIDVDGTMIDYNVYILQYNKALEPGETTLPSVYKVYMDTQIDINPDGYWYRIVDGVATTEEPLWNTKENGLPVIFVSAYAIQKDGFDNVDKAYKGYKDQWADNGYEYEEVVFFEPLEEATMDENGVITLKDGESVMLTGNVDETVTVKGNGSLHLRNLKITSDDQENGLVVTGTEAKLVVEGTVEITADLDAIHVEDGAKLDLSGEKGTLKAVGHAGTEDKEVKSGADGIGGDGEIYIHDLKGLTAEGYGVHGFGIGGSASKITIENTTIDYVKGGFVQQEYVSDLTYGKSEPEGGAAIGSSTDGAEITLKNVVVEEALGGSKAAGIGAGFWTGVTVNIENSKILYVQGGNASAGIGGSRTGENADASDSVTINITNSTVNAIGGQNGAGIGSGYNTHCTLLKETKYTVNIFGNSNITAQGGAYAAGIGTGYHVAALHGKIEKSVTVNAKSGDKFYKNEYTKAMDVGFGVVDPNREAANGNGASFDYQGNILTVEDAIANK